MNSSIFEQRSRFAMIGALMVIISLMFLFVCVDTSDLYLMYLLQVFFGRAYQRTSHVE